MKKALVLFAFATVLSAYAGNTATQTVTFSVGAINEIAVSGNPASAVVSGLDVTLRNEDPGGVARIDQCHRCDWP